MFPTEFWSYGSILRKGYFVLKCKENIQRKNDKTDNNEVFNKEEDHDDVILLITVSCLHCEFSSFFLCRLNMMRGVWNDDALHLI